MTKLEADAKYAELGRWCADEWAFANDIDGDALQDKALELGLVVPVSYDPDKHDVEFDCEPGEEIYIFTEGAQP